MCFDILLWSPWFWNTHFILFITNNHGIAKSPHIFPHSDVFEALDPLSCSAAKWSMYPGSYWVGEVIGPKSTASWYDPHCSDVISSLNLNLGLVYSPTRLMWQWEMHPQDQLWCLLLEVYNTPWKNLHSQQSRPVYQTTLFLTSSSHVHYTRTL